MAVVITNLALINNSNEALTKKEVHSVIYFVIILSFTLYTFKNKPFNERIINHYHFSLLIYLCFIALLSVIEWMIPDPTLSIDKHLLLSTIKGLSALLVITLAVVYQIKKIQINFFLMTGDYTSLIRAGVSPKRLKTNVQHIQENTWLTLERFGRSNKTAQWMLYSRWYQSQGIYGDLWAKAQHLFEHD